MFKLYRADNNLWINHGFGQYSIYLSNGDFAKLERFLNRGLGKNHTRSCDLDNSIVYLEKNGEDVNITIQTDDTSMILVCPKSELKSITF